MGRAPITIPPNPKSRGGGDAKEETHCAARIGDMQLVRRCRPDAAPSPRECRFVASSRSPSPKTRNPKT